MSPIPQVDGLFDTLDLTTPPNLSSPSPSSHTTPSTCLGNAQVHSSANLAPAHSSADFLSGPTTVPFISQMSVPPTNGGEILLAQPALKGDKKAVIDEVGFKHLAFNKVNKDFIDYSDVLDINSVPLPCHEPPLLSSPNNLVSTSKVSHNTPCTNVPPTIMSTNVRSVSAKIESIVTEI